jgi:hypothetical protein
MSEMRGDTTRSVRRATSGGTLIAEGLAAARRQHDERVATVDAGAYRFGLRSGRSSPKPQ